MYLQLRDKFYEIEIKMTPILISKQWFQRKQIYIMHVGMCVLFVCQVCTFVLFVSMLEGC